MRAKNDAGPVELDSRTKPGAATMVPGDHHTPCPKPDECLGQNRRGQTRSHIEDRIAGEHSRDVHAEISADLPTHDGQKADRAPSNDLPDRNDNKYADDFLAGLQGPHLSSPAAMPNRASAALPGHDEQHRGHLVVETYDFAALDRQRTPFSRLGIGRAQPVRRRIIVIAIERVAAVAVACPCSWRRNARRLSARARSAPEHRQARPAAHAAGRRWPRRRHRPRPHRGRETAASRRCGRDALRRRQPFPATRRSREHQTPAPAFPRCRRRRRIRVRECDAPGGSSARNAVSRAWREVISRPA